jgi:hypothetical protein
MRTEFTRPSYARSSRASASAIVGRALLGHPRPRRTPSRTQSTLARSPTRANGVDAVRVWSSRASPCTSGESCRAPHRPGPTQRSRPGKGRGRSRPSGARPRGVAHEEIGHAEPGPRTSVLPRGDGPRHHPTCTRARIKAERVATGSCTRRATARVSTGRKLARPRPFGRSLFRCDPCWRPRSPCPRGFRSAGPRSTRSR